MRFERILVAVDSSPVAARAAEVGAELARSLGAELAFLHAVDPHLSVAPTGAVSTAERLALAEDEARRLLAGFARRASLPAPALEFAPVGKPAGEIVKAAAEWPASLVVVGSRGHGGAARAVLGSVADSVMRHAPCPVVVVRADE